MFQRILLSLDGSSAAETAIPFARLIPSAVVRIVSVAPARHDVSPMFLESVRTSTGSSSEEVERAYLDHVGASLGGDGRTVETVVRKGDAAEEIIAASTDTDLIVMSTVRLGTGRLANDSVADRVIRHGNVPVLVVRANGPVAPSKIGRVVVPVDGSRLSEEALPTARRLGHDLRAPMHLIRVVDSSTPLDLVDVGVFSASTYEATLAAMQADARRELVALQEQEAAQGTEVGFDLLTGSPIARLLESIRPDDVVVLTTHGAGGTIGWCLGGVAEKLLRRSLGPIVMVHRRSTAAATIPNPRPHEVIDFAERS